jgi:hypothetical protein
MNKSPAIGQRSPLDQSFLTTLIAESAGGGYRRPIMFENALAPLVRVLHPLSSRATIPVDQGQIHIVGDAESRIQCPLTSIHRYYGRLVRI